MARPATGQIVERRGARGTTYAARFRAYGKRRYVTLDVATRAEAQTELENVLADVRRGIWREPASVNVVEAVELGYVDTNVARGKRRRLRADKPKRTWLELHEVQALLAAAEKHRPLIATMILAGL